jgi:hypothetical protein
VLQRKRVPACSCFARTWRAGDGDGGGGGRRVEETEVVEVEVTTEVKPLQPHSNRKRDCDVRR